MNRYFVLRGDGNAIEWTPPAPNDDVGLDMAYWGRVLEAMQASLSEQDLTFYLVWSLAPSGNLPSYGRDVIVIGVVGESLRRLPAWSSHVRTVIKGGGPGPELGVWAPSSALHGLTALGVWARGWVREIPGATAVAAARLRGGSQPSPQYYVPLGYHGQVDSHIKPMAERRTALSFAGSVRHWKGWWGRFTQTMGAPKAQSRQRMLEAATELSNRHPDLRVEMRITGNFCDRSPITGSYDPEQDRQYSDLLADTKICLVPRGAYLETFRHFEALRAGCVVVTDAWPDRWYLRDAPFVWLRTWDRLPDVVLPLLNDDAELERLHYAALEHWRRCCSEEAVGRFIADHINTLGANTARPVSSAAEPVLTGA